VVVRTGPRGPMPARTSGQPQSEPRNKEATPECPAAAATVCSPRKLSRTRGALED
jgi:hypothetical protein